MNILKFSNGNALSIIKWRVYFSYAKVNKKKTLKDMGNKFKKLVFNTNIL